MVMCRYTFRDFLNSFCVIWQNQCFGSNCKCVCVHSTLSVIVDSLFVWFLYYCIKLVPPEMYKSISVGDCECVLYLSVCLLVCLCVYICFFLYGLVFGVVSYVLCEKLVFGIS